MVNFIFMDIYNFCNSWKLGYFGTLVESIIFYEILSILGFILFDLKLVFY